MRVFPEGTLLRDTKTPKQEVSKKRKKKKKSVMVGPSAARRGTNRIMAERRLAGELVKKKAPKNKFWESEGDKLYHELCVDPNILFARKSPDEIVEAAKVMMSKLTSEAIAKGDAANESAPSTPEPIPSTPELQKSRFMWGKCSVGPLIKSRLEALGMPSPMPIQEACFEPISKRKSVVISSPTGSGNTLAFLLPILSITSRKKPQHVLIILASQELTRQVKGVIDSLWVPKDGESAVHILGESRALERPRFREELLSLGNAPILLGTPRDVRELMSQTQQAMWDRRAGCEAAHALTKSLQVVVLDEADKLLDSVSLVQSNRKYREMVDNQYENTLTKKQRKKIKGMIRLTETEMMFREDFPKALSECQFVCTSASVGRTLRRQLQGLLDATSIEKAATLISFSQMQAKQQRRASLMPRSLDHQYMFVDKGIRQGDPDYTLDRLAEIHATLIRSAMDKLQPKPAIVFCGPEGSDRLLDALRANGVTGARRLRDAHDDSESQEEMGEEMQEEMDEHKNPSDEVSWDTVPVHVGSERYGRGIDLDVDYVIMAQPPVSSGKYMHMAGRTGRRGKYGIAITLLEHWQSPLMKAFSEHLGISFSALGDAS